MCKCKGERQKKKKQQTVIRTKMANFHFCNVELTKRKTERKKKLYIIQHKHTFIDTGQTVTRAILILREVQF